MIEDVLIRHGHRCRLPIGILTALMSLLLFAGDGLAQSVEQTPHPRLEEYVSRRVREHPRDASAWRMLGRIRLTQNRFAEAKRAFQQAVELDPTSAAAQFDLGRLLVELGMKDESRRHLERATELAPESDYARQARDLLERIGPAEFDVQQVGYEIRRFDGADSIEPLLRESTEEERRSGLFAPFGFRLESGVLYNSNVALAPLSRQLSPEEPASAQGFLAPELQWVFLDRTRWRAGATLDGHFTLNEGQFRRFNLQSYQPGAFVESYHAIGTTVLIPRFSYEFTHDEFEAETFGNRHAAISSLWLSWNDCESSLLFWSIDHSDFRDDGVAPSITSQDGWTNVVGLSHDHLVDARFLKMVRGGVDYTHAETRGSDFRFDGVHLFAELLFALAWQTELKLHGGWGYRKYPDFEFSPPRDENVWRAGAELRRPFGEHLSMALVFNYVLFDSQNPLFEAERYLSGLVTTIEY